MNMNGNTITLDEVLQINKGYIPILDPVEYKYAALHPYPHGLRLKGQKRGKDFRGKRHQVIRAGQFVISRLRTQQHFWGIVPPDLDEAIVHRSYICFDIHPVLNPTYFAAYIGTPAFRQAVNRSRNKHGRLDVRRFSRTMMPMPSPRDQAYIADIWHSAVKAFENTAEMYSSIAALKAGVATDLFQKVAAAQSPKAVGNWVSMSRDLSAKCAVYLQNDGQLVKGSGEAQNTAVGILPKGDLDDQFLYYFLETAKVRWQNGLQNTRYTPEEVIMALPIAVPTLYEQRKIVVVLQQHEDVLQKLKVELHELRHFTSGMMQLIFSGKMPYKEALTVMQSLLA